jgi:hypothetical protein
MLSLALARSHDVMPKRKLFCVGVGHADLYFSFLLLDDPEIPHHPPGLCHRHMIARLASEGSIFFMAGPISG